MTLHLEVWSSLTPFQTLDSEVSLPNGYERAIKFNLAVELAPEYGTTLRPEVAQIANDSLSQIKNTNYRTPRTTSDLPINRGDGKRTYFPFR